MSDIINKLIDCELAYARCFSDCCEYQDILRFRDSLLPDMYDHNFTYVKNCMNDHKTFELITQEISLRMAEHQTFCKLLFGFPKELSLKPMFTNPPSVSRLGIYVLNKTSYLDLKGNNRCNILRIDNPETLKDKMDYDLLLDGGRLGEDFCRRRSAANKRVYLKDGSVDGYICYHNGVPVGTCDLYLHNGIAKIEDFTVLPQEQRKRYGTSILKHLIGQACDKKAQIIYLVTDENDTAKDMYRKFGFEKIYEMTDVLFLF
jgi:spore maturation protein CgeE